MHRKPAGRKHAVTLLHETHGPRLVLSGEMDVATLPQFQQQIDTVLPDPPPQLVLDLSQVTFFGAAGVRLLLQLAQRIPASQGPIVLVTGDRVRRVLDLLDFSKRFRIAGTAAEAARALNADAMNSSQIQATPDGRDPATGSPPQEPA